MFGSNVCAEAEGSGALKTRVEGSAGMGLVGGGLEVVWGSED